MKLVNTFKTFITLVFIISLNTNLFTQTAEEWKKLGNIELNEKNYEKAIEYYKKSIEVDSNYFDSYHNLCLVFYKTDEFEKAASYCNKAISINDKDASTLFILANVYSEQKEYKKAIKMLREGLKLEPESPSEYNLLGYLYQETGNYVYSMFYLKKAAQLGETDVQQYFIENNISWENDFEVPNYEKIKANIEDKKSSFYYPKLWGRFQKGDSTLTLDEKRHLYFGYVFNEKYSPYNSVHDSKQVNEIINKENPSKKELKNLVSLFNTSLGAEPFNIRYLYYQKIAYELLKKPKKAKQNMEKIFSVYDAIYSTGDGLSKETAFHVIAVYSEYDFLFVNDFSIISQALINGGYDVLYLKSNEEGIEELWFEINQPLKHLNKLFNQN